MSKVVLAIISGLPFFVCLSLFTVSVSAQVSSGVYRTVRVVEPGWSPYVLAPPQVRSQLAQMPVQHRPYRPLHFYGNTMRRTYHRGTPLPAPREIMGALPPLPPFARVLLRR